MNRQRAYIVLGACVVLLVGSWELLPSRTRLPVDACKGFGTATQRRIKNIALLTYYGRCTEVDTSYVDTPPHDEEITNGIVLATIWPTMEGYFRPGSWYGKKLEPGQSVILLNARLAQSTSTVAYKFHSSQNLYDTSVLDGKPYGLTHLISPPKVYVGKNAYQHNKDMYVQYKGTDVTSFIVCDTYYKSDFKINPQCDQETALGDTALEIVFSRRDIADWKAIDVAVFALYRRLTSS